MNQNLILHSYYRSSAAWRVRLALAIKNLPFNCINVNLIKDGGEHHLQKYQQINPQSLVPTLEHGHFKITQSLAIIEYIDETFGEPELIFGTASLKATIRQQSLIIAADIHPINNLRIQQYLETELGILEEEKLKWYRHWIEKGFSALEALLTESAGKFAIGDAVSMVDCCLIPQVYNAKRFDVPLDAFPNIVAINEHCSQLSSFIQAHPDSQINN